MGIFDYLLGSPDEYDDFYTPGLGYWPSAGRRIIGDIFGAGKRGVDYLATQAYKSEPTGYDPITGRPYMQDRPGLENLDTMPVEEMAVEATMPKILPGDPQIPTPYQGLYNLGRGTTRVGTRFAMDPMAYGMNLPGKAGSAIGGYFGLEGLLGAKEGAERALEAPNLTEAIEPAVEAIGSGLMGGLGLHSLTRGMRGSKSRIPDTPERIEGPFEVPESNSAPVKEHALADLVLDSGEVYIRRFENMAEAALGKVRDLASDTLQDPRVKDIKIQMGSWEGETPAYYDRNSNTIFYDPNKMSGFTSPEVAKTLLHEIAHTSAEHDFPGVRPKIEFDSITDKLVQQRKGLEEFEKYQPKRAYSPIGEGKFAEVDPALAKHLEKVDLATGETVDPSTERAKYSSEEHAFQTAYDSLLNNPEIFNIVEQYGQNLKKARGEHYAETTDISHLKGTGVKPSDLVSAPGKAPGISEPANIFRKILEEAKLTRFNRNTLAKELESRGIAIPDEIKQQIPALIDELKSVGIANEKIAGTMTLMTGPPKKKLQPKAAETKGPVEPVMSIEDQLKASIENIGAEKKQVEAKPAETKPPNIEQQMKEKLTADEIRAIGKIFGPQAGKKIEKPVSEEVKLAQKAAEKAGQKGKPPIPKQPIREEKPGEAAKKQFKVTLSDGTEHVVKAVSETDATAKANSILQKHGSSKTVDKVEEKLSSLEMAAKEEISSQKQGEEVTKEELAAKKSAFKGTEKVQESELRDQLKVESAFKKAAEKETQTEEQLREKAHEAELKSQIKVENEYTKAQNKQRMKEAKELEKKKKQAERLEKGFEGDVLDIPKTLKASFDVSWPGRQGLFLLNRRVARQGMTQGLKSGLPFKGEEFHMKTRAELATRPNAELYKKSGLNQFTYDPTESTTVAQRSEEFPARRFAEKIPGVKQSERMFLDMGNLARANMFDEFAAKFERQGKTFETNPELYKALGDYLNVLTLRKPLPEKLQQAGWILNKMFFSPMAVYSRLQQANPYWYAKLPPELQKAAIRDVGGTLGTITTLLGGISYAASQAGMDESEVHFETDPAATHFGRLKVGNTYYDLHGMTPMLRTMYRITSGRKKTVKGEYALPGSFGYSGQESLPDAPFGETAWGELGKFVENKTSPIFQASKGLFTGKDWYGNEYDFQKLLIDLFAPMSIESMGEAGSRYGATEAAKQIPEIVGFSTYTAYPDEKTGGRSKKKRKLDLVIQ